MSQPSQPSQPNQANQANQAGNHSSTLKRAFAAIDQLQRELEEVRRRRTEPIAVVGLGCRFPGGAVDADSYWKLLAGGVDAIRETPADRWDVEALYDTEAGSPGKMNTRWGGFLDGIDQFDPGFFGISPREAEAMDPNQRLALEVTWEALENAGYAKLAGTKTSVFIGVIATDYGMQRLSDPADVSGYSVQGNALSVISGRISYLLDLRGPAVTIDTACSSSASAVYLACQSLRAGDSDLSLAGGVNVILSPVPTVALSQFGMMSPDGRCHTFDAAANGFVRGEGCGMVVLKRLSDAMADGDDVLAVIRGGAMNQDGRSTGLTAPNVLSQRDVVLEALRATGVESGQVSFVEAHGTGTTLGDPIEVEALAEVYPAEPGDEWHLGAVKTNFGHLEAASGVASLIKVILALRHRAIPPNLHFERLNPLIALEHPPFTVPTRLTDWALRGGRRIAGVSSFGLSGTNVHLLVEEGPQRPEVVEDTRRPLSVLALSARSEAGLRALATRHRERLAGSPVPVADYCYSANTGRIHNPHRLAVVGGSARELDAALAAALDGPGSPASRTADGLRPEVAFLFGGTGVARPGTASALYATSPAFREALDRCDALLRPQLEVPLLDLLLQPGDGTADLRRPSLAQPALFSVEFALAELWRSWGVEPAAVLGHGAGEVVAACVAGVLSLEDALRLVVGRGRVAEALLDAPDDAQLLAPLRQVAGGIAQAAPRIPFVSTVDGALWPWGEAPGAEHWCRQLREPAHLAEGVSTLLSLGHTVVLGVGDDAPPDGGGMLSLPGLAAGPDAWRPLLSSLAELYRHGAGIDWAGFDRGYGRARVPVPTSPFVRSRYWLELPEPRAVAPTPRDGGAPAAATADAGTGPAAGTAPGSAPRPGPGPAPGSAPGSGDGTTLTHEALLAVPEAERFDVLADHLARGVQRALGSGGGPRRRGGRPAAGAPEVGLDRPFLDLGFDSLMAMGLKNQIRTQLGVTLPISGLLQNGSVRRVTEQILERLADGGASGPADAPPIRRHEPAAAADDVDALLAELERLPEAEAQALLEGGR